MHHRGGTDRRREKEMGEKVEDSERVMGVSPSGTIELLSSGRRQADRPGGVGSSAPSHRQAWGRR